MFCRRFVIEYYGQCGRFPSDCLAHAASEICLYMYCDDLFSIWKMKFARASVQQKTSQQKRKHTLSKKVFYVNI